jgi:hypothetical protein
MKGIPTQTCASSVTPPISNRLQLVAQIAGASFERHASAFTKRRKSKESDLEQKLDQKETKKQRSNSQVPRPRRWSSGHRKLFILKLLSASPQTASINLNRGLGTNLPANCFVVGIFQLSIPSVPSPQRTGTSACMPETRPYQGTRVKRTDASVETHSCPFASQSERQ